MQNGGIGRLLPLCYRPTNVRSQYYQAKQGLMLDDRVVGAKNQSFTETDNTTDAEPL
jgi:hypothetical protein